MVGRLLWCLISYALLCLQPSSGAHLEAGDLSAADAQIEAISWVDQQLAYIVDTVDTLRNEVL